MAFPKRVAAALAVAFLFCFPSFASDQRPSGDFDFYVLSLSWSPSFCAEEGDAENTQQCASARPYGFIVHGLWPQYERGYPRDCYTGQRRVPDSLVEQLRDIMPSAGLVGHQWRMHGSCSGMSQTDYFRTVRAAFREIEIPQQFQGDNDIGSIGDTDIERAFSDANPGMPEDGISVSCSKRLLREVRICLTRDLQFRTCGELERKSCKADDLRIPRLRGKD
ncbi:MAG: ribonuclease T2 [Rhizobiaceae bacterium]|nr:ribonuclease T2 [Rhizobiaceae bacterium]